MNLWKRTILPVLLLLLTASVYAVDLDDTRLLDDPDVSAEHVAFAYAGDIWIAGLDGSHPRRLTSHAGVEHSPRFSPDGRHLAFSAEYDGNIDVYVVATAGGAPRRLTWHPGNDQVWDFTPDGRAVLFGSQRNSFTRRNAQLFTVAIAGGFPEQLPVPKGRDATFSPDGRRIAYNPDRRPFEQWKNYRGGTASRIWIQDLGDHKVEEIPQGEGRSNDVDAMWIGEKIYFRSDRNGEFNLFAYDLQTKGIVQITRHQDFPVLDAAAGGDGRIIYEQAGYLHLLDPATGRAEQLRIGVATDSVASRPRWAEGSRFLRNAAISSSGARAAFEFRGEIVTVPAEKGDIRNITATVDVHERSPVWSPDGKSLAYFSDTGGEYKLHVAPQDGRGEARVYEIGGAGFYDTPRFSPDGKKLSFIDNSWSLYMIDLESGEVTKIFSELVYGPVRTLHHAWSPDSRWLAYTSITETYFQVVNLYSLEEKRSHKITDGLSDVAEPVFDKNGEYLYFTASTDAGPLRQWFAMSNSDDTISRSLYAAVLKSGEPSPFAPESDEETKDEDDADGEKKDEGKSKAGKDKDKDSKDEDSKDEDSKDEKKVEIDFDGLGERIVALPVGEAFYTSLTAGAEGQLYYLHREGRGRGIFFGGGGELRLYDFGKREETTLADGVDAFVLSADRKKILVQKGESWTIADAGKKIDGGKGQLKVGGIRVRVDPRAEWEQIFNEAWRINRDYFYDPGMHGADWPAMREKYAALLPHVATRRDLNRVIQWMSSEIAVGHHRVGGGDFFNDTEEIPGGLLGADYEIHAGRYRFAKVYGGLNWNPDLRSPLTEPGVEVKAGDYLLAVDGRALDASENLYSRFEATSGRIVELEVSPNADGSDSRTVQVVPIPSELSLRNRDWVEGNLRKVDEATDGRVAYVYVPNTATLGHVYFKRYFYPQAHKPAIIVDERGNGGGQVADYYIDVLRRPLISFWATRYGQDIKTPIASIQGPKAMLIDENAGSGGDLLPWMFRQLKLGPLIGRRTWGGLVGTLGFPTLMDGGFISAPNLGFWSEEEGFGVENVGVPPDIEVEQWPAAVNAGRDPQLEKAIEVILEELEKNPPAEPERPPFPIRVRR